MIHKLEHFLSQEDFGDAHEPLNDGIKEVPNAQTVAESVGSTVSETTENESLNQGEITEEDKPAVDPEPDVKHETVKDVESETKAVVKETESLEAFLPKVKRSEILGYSKRDVESLTRSIRVINKVSGIKGDVTVSAESIDQAITNGQERLKKLHAKHSYLSAIKVSSENHIEAVPVNDLNQMPLQTPDSEVLPPEVGAAITIQELEIIDPENEPSEINAIQEQVAEAQQAMIALEGYHKLFKENDGKLSKQACAIIQVGLDHIDRKFNLKVRTTGFESFDTSPKSAMQRVSLEDEGSFKNRMAEIGAKVIAYLKKLFEEIGIKFKKLQGGVYKLENMFDLAIDKVKKLPDSTEVENFTFSTGFMELFGDAVNGFKVTNDEMAIVKDMEATTKKINKQYVPFIANKLADGTVAKEGADFFKTLAEYKLAEGGHVEYDIPGAMTYTRHGLIMRTRIDINKMENVESLTIPMPPKKDVIGELEVAKGIISRLGSDDQIRMVKDSVDKLMDALGKFRKTSAINDADSEVTFQAVQQGLNDNVFKYISLDEYFKIVRTFMLVTQGRVQLANAYIKAYK